MNNETSKSNSVAEQNEARAKLRKDNSVAVADWKKQGLCVHPKIVELQKSKTGAGV